MNKGDEQFAEFKGKNRECKKGKKEPCQRKKNPFLKEASCGIGISFGTGRP